MEHDIPVTQPDVSPTRPLSLSQLRLFHRCAYAWKLHYQDGYLPIMSAAAWRGSLVHAAIRLAHHGVPLEVALDHVWHHACGPVLPQLKRFLALDDAYRAAGRPQTTAAQQWRREHPEYDEVLQAIRDFQTSTLGHLRWGEHQGLEDYYAWSIRMLDDEPDIVLPDPVLIEGEVPRGSSSDILAEAETQVTCDDAGVEEIERRASGRLLMRLGGQELRIVPDVVALDGGGEVARVCDYKMSDRALPPEVLAEDAQLHLYVLGLRQNGVIRDGQATQIGHITLTAKGPVRVFVRLDEVQHARVVRRLEQLAETAAKAIACGQFPAHKGLHHPFLSPCTTCDVAHVCDA